MSATAAAAADLIAEAQADYPPEEEGPQGEAEQAEAAEQEQEPAGPVFDVQLPEDVQAILAAEEPAPEEPDTPDEDDAAYWDDSGDQDNLRAELHKLQKKNAYLEQQTVKAARPGWEAEIGQYFKFVDAKEIAAQASSRREAIRMAAQVNDQRKKGGDIVAEYYETNIEKIVQERVAETEAKLKAQWGEPVGGPGQAPALAAVRSEEQAQIQNARTLHERTALKIKHGLLGL